ncbi:MAG: D-amino acid dehydrogenase [Gammaproteobacteria bacterium]
MAGVATAWFLRRNGADVTVIDRRNDAAMETSHANAGMLTPSMADPWNHPGLFWRVLKWLGREDSPMLLRPSALPSLAGWGLRFLRNSAPGKHRANTLKNVELAKYSLHILNRLAGELPIDFHHLRRGTIKLFRDQESLDEFLRLAEILAMQGLQYQRLDRRELVELEPCLEPVRDELIGGLLYPGDESGDAREFCSQLSRLAEGQGVEFRFEQTILRLIADNRRFRAVETATERFEADACVVAAGSFSPLLVRSLGLRLPIRPVKGYSISIPLAGWSPAPTRPLVDETLHLAATPLGDILRVAGSAELAGWNTDVRDARIRNLIRFVDKLFPTLHINWKSAEVGRWAGLRPMSCDGVPVLGPTPVEGLFFNTGHGHLGWTMSSGAGKLVADAVTGRATEIALEPYAFQRFERW